MHFRNYLSDEGKIPKERNTSQGEAVTLGKNQGIPIIKSQDIKNQMPKGRFSNPCLNP